MCSWLQETQLVILFLAFSSSEHFNGRVEEEKGAMEVVS